MGKLWIAVALLTTLLAGGWMFADATVYSGAQVEERTLRIIASMAAGSLDMTAVGQLTGTLGDEGSPAFATIRTYLKRVLQALPEARYAYLMGERDGEVIFLVDAEDQNLPTYSPPGETYPEASPALIAMFSNGEPFVEEPYRDRWGEWTSGLAAVREQGTGRIIAVLGIDIPADQWRHKVDGYRIYGMAIAAIIVGLMTSVLVAQWRE
jgi:hypothetical protein